MIRILNGPTLLVGAISLSSLTLVASPLAGQVDAAEARLAAVVTQLEVELGARVGVAVRQVETGWQWSHRGEERFPMASTFKPLLCAHVLAAVARGEARLDRVIPYGADDVVSWSPLTEERDQITLGDACAAALSHSDNTAANLAMKALGGPGPVTSFLRQIGDETTRVDRWEPQLNEAIPGDPRDTSTPLAMASSLEKVTLGAALGAGERTQLLAWMEQNTVSGALLRSVLPSGWQIADRSGAGQKGTRNITAVLHDPRGGGAVVVIFMTGAQAEFAVQNEAVARIGEEVIAALSRE